MRFIDDIKSCMTKVLGEGEDGFAGILCVGGFQFQIIFSYGEGWEHASIIVIWPSERCPTWDEMCMIKDIFWAEDEAVMQLHPPKKDYVNIYSSCLHLWRPMNELIPLPPKDLV